MPIDPTIPLQARNNAADPFQTIGNALQIKNSLLQNQVNQQTLDSNRAWSKAVNDNTDEGGNVNWGAARSQAARTGVNFNVLQNGSALTTNNQQTQQLTQAQLDQAIQRQGVVNSTVSSLAADPGLGTADMTGKAVGAVKSLVNAGILSMEDAKRYVGDFPTNDPAAQATWIRTHAARVAAGVATLRNLAPVTTTVNNGQQQIGISQSPLTGQVVGSPYQVQNQVGPESNAAIVQVQNPDGSFSYRTAGEVRAATGAPVSQGASGYTGRPVQPMTASNSPATIIGQKAGAEQSANVYAADQNAGNASQNNLSSLRALRDALVAAGPSGPGTQALNTARSWLVAHGMAQGDADRVANYDEAVKLMTQYANAGGGGTDARLDAAIKSNPNPNLSTKANLAIIDRLTAIEQMNQDRQQAFSASGLSPEKYQAWKNDWNKTHGIGTYQFDALTPEQQRGFLDAMTPQQRQQWAQGYSDFKTRSGGVQ